MINRIQTTRRRAAARTIAILAITLGLAACNNFLTADNPGAIEAKDVNDPTYLALISNGPIFGFQDAQDDQLFWNGVLADELYNRATFIEEGQIDRRDLYSDMTYINAFMYSPMQRARFLGEDAASRLKTILGDSAAKIDVRVARSLAYAGYSYVYLGETFCTTPIDLGVPKTLEEMMADAIVRFQEAITIATAAKAYLQTQPVSTANTTAIAASDSIRNFALVGAARAALNRNDKAQAIAFANQVPAGFDFRAYYNDNAAAQRHRTYERLTQGKNATMNNTPFLAMAGDPRVPRIGGTTTNAGTPLSPPSYSTWNNTVAGADFAAVMTQRIASYLEAQYIIAEAQGPTAATLTFVNSRRAAGLQTNPIVLAGDPLMAELRDQKSRDFYLDGHRLGDLRRYKQYYNVDLFPKGTYPGTTSGAVYNQAITCWPLPTNEINGNPNIPKG